MAVATPIPATVVPVPTWTNINLARNASIVSGALTPNIMVNAQVGVVPYVADPSGNLLAPINSAPALPGAPANTSAIPVTATSANVVLNLSEVITRADGSKVTVLQLLDSIAMAAATA
jgi:hypothetical protein